jgi:uncharacterized protein
MDEALIHMLRLSTFRGVTMKCPTCTNTLLVMAERQGVEIDYCPACRGIWLDRAAAASPASLTAPAQQAQPAQAVPRQSGYGDRHYGHDDRDHYKRKKSWLHEIFD